MTNNKSNLSPTKRALLAKWIRGELPAYPIPRRQKLDLTPLSFAQERLWFLEQLEPDSSLYNEFTALSLQGTLNVAALLQSLNEIVQRHEILRTRFIISDGQPIQVITPTFTLALPMVNLDSLPTERQENEIQSIATKEAEQPFNLQEEPLIRVTLLKLSQVKHILLLTMHHIVWDLWSAGILMQEVAALYQSCSQGQSSALPELPIQYADFAVWQRQWLHKEVLETQMSYWQQQLDGSQSILNLPTDYPRPMVMSHRGAMQSFILSQEISEAFKTLSQQEGVTLFMSLLAAFKTLLYRYSQQEDILVGTTIAGRNREELEELIGFFVNTLVLRTNLGGNPSFRQLLARVREVALGAYAHQDVPFEQLVEKLKPERNLSHTPLFQVMFQLQNTPTTTLKLPGLTLTPLEFDSRTAKFDLTLSMIDDEQGLIGSLEYNTDLFSAATISRMLEHFQTLLAAIVINPEQHLSDLPLLTATEKHQLLVQWNDTQTDYSQNQCIHQLFEAQVERSPDAIAIVFADQHLTYQELNQRANQLADHLQTLGVKPEVLVGICLERSLEMVVGILGILKAGGAYLPLDPSYPQERLSLMLEDAKPLVLLTQQQLIAGLPKHQAQVVCLDAESQTNCQNAQYTKKNQQFNPTPANLAYVIYTSGSTGKPKGVAITHQALVNHSIAVAKAYQLQPNDRILQFASFSFDVAAEELFPSWLSGSTVVLRSDQVLMMPNFLHFLVEEQLTVLNLPTAYWHEWVSYLAQTVTPLPTTLRLVVTGTEPALPEKLRLWQQQAGDRVRWINAYGPTEATIGATSYEPLTEPESQQITCVPIGHPITNTQIYLLDKHLNPTPIGVPGELHIGGIGLARGYLNHLELTAEKFIPNLFSNLPGERLYKTGDLARYLPDGNIEILGRIDHQVKIRGFRIELTEIEASLKKHLQIQQAVVIALKDESAKWRLVAYVSPHLQQELTVTELRSFLNEKLPLYAIPSTFVILPALPQTPNGKVDRQALPLPNNLRPELAVAYVMPQTEVEKSIAQIWRQALNIEKIGIHDNFFELGGHSLLIIKVHSQLDKIVKTNLSILDLFRYPTISSLAEYLSRTNSQILSDSEINIQLQKLEAGKNQQEKRLKKMKSIENIKGLNK